MSFAAAAFLAGFALLALPWWLHRRDTHRPDPQVVSSLLLLRPGEAPEQMRKTLRHRWLMALRMLLFAVLVLAFAQPVLRERLVPEVGTPRVPQLIAVDTSLSMAADFAAARQRAHALIDGLPPDVPAAVVGLDGDITVAAPLGTDRQALHAAVAGLRPGNGRLAFEGLSERLTVLAGSTREPVALHLISDFQRTALPAQFNALVDGAQGPIELHPVPPAGPNWRVEGIHVDRLVTVAVRGFGTPERSLDVRLDGPSGELGRRSLTVPADGTAHASFPLPPRSDEDVWLEAVVDAGDALAVDDVGYAVVRRLDAVPMPMYVAPTAAAQAEYLRVGIAAALPRFQPAALDQSGPVAVALDPADLPAQDRQALERHLANGGAVLMTVGPATRRAARVPLLDLPLEEGARDGEPRRVVVADRTHPALAGTADWSAVAVSRYLRAAPAAGTVLLRLDDGAPLLLEHPAGAGRVLLLLTALDPAWSNLVTTAAFVTWLADAVGHLAEDTLPVTALAGETLTIPSASVQVFDASGRRM
ncbi:MAG TPA: BatA and WFA domain-containing protein, partial [Pseudomonadales bacterium]